MSEPRYVPALASWTDSDGNEGPTSYGVLDTLENTFAPFIGEAVGPEIGDQIAAVAAEAVAKHPDKGWTFFPDFTLASVEAPAQRFEWIKASYGAYGQETAWGAVDNELGRFYPFSDDEHDPDAEGFVASVAAAPEGKYAYPATFTRL